MRAKKAVVLGLVAALAVLIGALRPGLPVERSQAVLPVGGIAVLPSALPGLPPFVGVFEGMAQPLPLAIAPASGEGSFAIVDVFCATGTSATFACPRDRAGSSPSGAPITFTMSKLLPPGEPIRARFTANGGTELKCQDDASCDLTDYVYEAFFGAVQHVAVGITGGGDNEVIEITACDGSGDCRSKVNVLFIETMLTLNPGVIGDSAAEGPTFVSYKCDDVGRYYGQAAPGIVPGTGGPPPDPPGGVQASTEVTWEEVFDWFYGMPTVGSARLRSPLTALPMPDIPFYSCGGDTSSPVDDRVNFETDLGILSVEALADGASTAEVFQAPSVLVPFGTLSTSCDVGDSVDVLDHPGPVTLTRGIFNNISLVPEIPASFCDLDFAPNGVVTYALWGTGEAGAATVTGQQSGGGGVLRTGYPSLTGRPRFVFFSATPDVITAEGGDFQVVIIDQQFRFIGGQTLFCSAEPKEAVLMIVPQTGTTGSFPEPWLNFTVYPTLSALATGVELTVTCILADDPDVKPVLGPAVVRIGSPAESVDLVAGCNPVTSTWPDDTAIETVVDGVAPPEALDAIWLLDPATGEWQGYSAAAPEASDLASLDQLDAVFMCMNASATMSRPQI